MHGSSEFSELQTNLINMELYLRSILIKYLPQSIINVIRQIPRPILFKGFPRYKQDGLATIHNCEFMNDKLFTEAYKLGDETGSSRN